MEFLQSKESGTSDRSKYKSNGAENNNGAYLVWEDLTVVAQSLKNGTTKKLVSGLSGYAEPDRIMAIMGPSGSGKSTLLDALAGRLSRNTLMTGNILLNGKKAPIDSRDVSYVTQDDYFLGTLSVREILTYSSHLRLPSKMTNNEIDEIVQETIVKMGLQDCAENKIGNWHLRGISTGEKRRLSIGVEILTQPKVLFLDEPTSGLDSASAFFVLLVLNSIAHDGRIVVCSVHQPSGHLFDLFDDLLLLSNGETIYFGDAKLAVKVIPTSSNSQIKLTTDEIKAKLVEKYKDSDISKNMRKRVQELALSEQVEIVSNKSNAGWWKQLWTLSGRSFLNMSRDMGYYWLRTLFYILVSVSAGNLYFNIGLSYQSIVQRAKCDAFVYGFMICLSIGGLPFFLEEFKMLMMMASEIFKLLPDLPKFFWRYPMSYISFASWAIQGQYKNDMIGLDFDPQNPGDTEVKGEEVLQKIFGVELDHSKWCDLLALLVLLVSYRLILLAALKYKEKSLSLLRRLYASHFRQPVKQLMLMKEKFISSKTNQPTP
ncbi:hypothetical protein LWI29_015815 [Acer saccharum]|uniref:ABC transporter domain-containing protein n=1 Tax=Acer saccharum TaxID=4024 RepID=A0AA39VXA0_ACESA|nr:hypothetical protein LWI29_015815 [Acer saccharum]